MGQRILFIVALILFGNLAVAQLPEAVGESVPKNWTSIKSGLTASSDHYKSGKKSVKWTWKQKGASIRITDTSFASAAVNPRSTFVIWIYNDRPVNDSLTFEFSKEGKRTTYFPFSLDFRGWRTAWVMYNRDMYGKPEPAMDRLTIHAPRSVREGSLFLDGILYNVTINPRSPMRDDQVPFVNPQAIHNANAHWTGLYWFSRQPHYLPLSGNITEREINELGKIFSQFKSVFFPAGRAGAFSFKQIQREYEAWDIKVKGNTITGRPVYSVNDSELFGASMDADQKKEFKQYTIDVYSQLMLKIAKAFHTSKSGYEKKQLSGMFIRMLNHLNDQGWSAGSGMGALHHMGYNFRDFYPACLLMKPEIVKNKLLERTFATMSWYSGLGRSQKKYAGLSDSNIDVFNTVLNSMLSTILIMEDTPEKVRQMKEFSYWFSQALGFTYSIDGTFKPDGSVVHHGNLYPAYGLGGIQGAAAIIYSLSQTSFQVTREAQDNLKKVMLRMHYYTNPLYWPISVSGRHPTGNWKIGADAYAYMGMSVRDSDKQKADTLMAAIYLRIANKGNEWSRRFERLGIKPADYPAGHWNINYGIFDIHRRKDWLATVRGHNRYFTTHEAYPGANEYGRYLSYGFLEVTYPQTLTDDGGSFKDKGWNWNHIPGTTTLNVPMEKLRARILNVDDFSGVEEMLLSDQTFAGGTNFNDWHGVFGMKLHGHDKYEMGDFRANKSWFMFDSLIICLGSDISNANAEYPTQTTILQNVQNQPDEPFYFNGKLSREWPYQNSWKDVKGLVVVDNRNIGYYIPDQKEVTISRKKQASRDQKNIAETSGDVSTLLIEHGKAPVGESYEYVVIPSISPEAMAGFKHKMQGDNPYYKILQQDSIAHTVYYVPDGITASVLFTSEIEGRDSVILSNSRPALLMYQLRKDTLSMSVTDPDLAFYTGPDDSPVSPEGRREEVSIYSRRWYKSPAQPTMVNFTIKGSWRLSGNDDSHILITHINDNNTLVSIPCQFGLASGVHLVKTSR